MTEYHKIHSLYKRDETGKKILAGEYALPEFEYLSGNVWEFTEKVDGTNIRVYSGPSGRVFGGKTDAAQIPAKLLSRLEDLFPKDCFTDEIFKDAKQVVLYGEGFGAGIQKGGGNYSPNQDFVLFDVNIDGWWLLRRDVEDIASHFGIPVVPVIGEGTLSDLHNMVAEGFDSRWGAFMAEGIVARPKVPLCSRSGHRIITKLKHRDFR